MAGNRRPSDERHFERVFACQVGPKLLGLASCGLDRKRAAIINAFSIPVGGRDERGVKAHQKCWHATKTYTAGQNVGHVRRRIEQAVELEYVIRQDLCMDHRSLRGAQVPSPPRGERSGMSGEVAHGSAPRAIAFRSASRK
jgi:hypothetical protein